MTILQSKCVTGQACVGRAGHNRKMYQHPKQAHNGLPQEWNNILKGPYIIMISQVRSVGTHGSEIDWDIPPGTHL